MLLNRLAQYYRGTLLLEVPSSQMTGVYQVARRISLDLSLSTPFSTYLERPSSLRWEDLSPMPIMVAQLCTAPALSRVEDGDLRTDCVGGTNGPTIASL